MKRLGLLVLTFGLAFVLGCSQESPKKPGAGDKKTQQGEKKTDSGEKKVQAADKDLLLPPMLPESKEEKKPANTSEPKKEATPQAPATESKSEAPPAPPAAKPGETK